MSPGQRGTAAAAKPSITEFGHYQTSRISHATLDEVPRLRSAGWNKAVTPQSGATFNKQISPRIEGPKCTLSASIVTAALGFPRRRKTHTYAIGAHQFLHACVHGFSR